MFKNQISIYVTGYYKVDCLIVMGRIPFKLANHPNDRKRTFFL